MSGVSNVSQSNNTQFQDSLGVKKSAENGVSDFTNTIMNGGNLGDSIANSAENMKETAETNLKQIVQDAIVKGLKRLFIGNDATDAGTAQVKTAANVGTSAAKVTAVQSKLLSAGLSALKDLVTTGEIDINTYATKVKDAVKLVGDKNEAGKSLTEQKTELTKSNEEIAAKLKEYGIVLGEQKTEGKGEKGQQTQIVMKDKDGKEVTMQTTSSEGCEKGEAKTSLPSDAQELISQYQTNLDAIGVLDEQLGVLVTEQGSAVAEAQEAQVTIESEKTNLTQNLQNTSQQVQSDANVQINSQVTTGNVTLKTDATTATVNGSVDAATTVAAPPLAASITAGTFGFGSGEAANILSNGVQDGIATGLRIATGSTALGGIAANVMSGKSLGAALQSAVINEVNNQISSTISELASGLQIGELDVGALVAPELSAALQIEDPNKETKSA